LLWHINEQPAPVVKLTEFILVHHLECTVYDGHLVKDELVTWFKRCVRPKIVSRIQDIDAIVDEVDTINKIVLPSTYRNEYLHAPENNKKGKKTICNYLQTIVVTNIVHKFHSMKTKAGSDEMIRY
jgi:hypothetical protein